MENKKMISLAELKKGFCLDTIKGKILNDEIFKEKLNKYLCTHEDYDFADLVNYVEIECALYFKGFTCTYNIWDVCANHFCEIIRFEFDIYGLRNNHLNYKNHFYANLEEINGVYTFRYRDGAGLIFDEEEKEQCKYDIEVGKLIFQYTADLLNNLLQEVEK